MTDIPTYVVWVGALVQKDGKFLIGKRAAHDDQAPDQWSILGGKVEINGDVSGDVVLQQLKQELREEVGIEIADQIEYLDSDTFIRSSGHRVVGITFLANHLSGEAMPLEDQSEVSWLSIEELEALVEEKRVNFLKPIVAKLKLKLITNPV